MPDAPFVPDPLDVLRQRLRPFLADAIPATALITVRADVDAGRFDDLLVPEEVEAWIPAAQRLLETEPGAEELLLAATTGWLMVRVFDQQGDAVPPDVSAAMRAASWRLIAEACFDLGISFYQQRQLVAAEEGFAEAEGIYRELLAAGRTELAPRLATTLINRGIVLTDQGQLTAALRAYAEAEGIYRELLAGGRTELAPRLARTLMHRGNVLADQRQLTAALTAYAEAEGRFRKLIAAGRTELVPSLARTLMNRGVVLTEQGQLSAALMAVEEAEGRFRKLIAAGRTELEPDLATTLMNRGNVLRQQGQLTAALAVYDEAEERFRELLAAGRTELAPRLATTLINRGIVLTDQGQLTAALRAYAEAEGIYRELLASGRDELGPDLADNLMNRGNVLADQRQLVAALRAYAEAEGRFRKLIAAGRTELIPDLAKTLMNRGVVLLRQGQLAPALRTLEEAEERYRKLLDAGRAEVAPEFARTLMNRGVALAEQGQLTAALTAYTGAEARFRDLLAAGRTEQAPGLAMTLVNRGTVLADQGQLPAALAAYDDALALCQQAGQAAIDLHWRVLYQRAQLLAAQGEIPAARNDLDAALALLEQHAGEQTSLDDRLAVRESALDVYRLTSRLRLMDGVDAAAVDVFVLAQRAKGRTLADLYPLQATDLTASSPERALAGLKVQQRELLRRAAILAQGPPPPAAAPDPSSDRSATAPAPDRDTTRSTAELAPTNDASPDRAAPEPTTARAAAPDPVTMGDLAAVTAKLTALEAEITEARDELARTDPGRALLATGAVRTLAAEFAPVLHPGEALLDVFDLGPDNGVFFALLLPTQSTVAWGGFLPDEIFAPLLARWDDAPTHENNFDRWKDVTDHLGPVLFPPDLLQRLDEAGVTHLILCPSGRLHSLPFAALKIRVDDALVLLSERFVLSLVPTATSLWLLRTQSAPLPDAVTVLAAAPFSPVPLTEADLERMADGHRDPSAPTADGGPPTIPWTGHEVQTVADLFASAIPHAPHAPLVLAGTAATRAAVLELLPAATHVLLASHGQRLAAGESLLEYQLLFAPAAATEGAAGPAPSVVLTVREVFTRPRTLSNVVQLCLTACHLGEVVLRGEEALGFGQAFLSAGVRVVLAPLWAVHDQATALLSIAYHAALLRPERPTVGEAWQEAMAEVRNHSDFEHPRYWAAFLPAGDAALRLPPHPPA